MGKSGVKEISDISIEEFEQTWRANCGSAFLLTQLCIPAMEKKAWGRVIFCSSVAGFTGGSIGPHYAQVEFWSLLCEAQLIYVSRSSKSAMHGLIHWLAGAYAKKGVTVNGVAPALIGDTMMLPGNSQELAKRKSHNPPSSKIRPPGIVVCLKRHDIILSTLPRLVVVVDTNLCQRNTGGCRWSP